jgi:hypothetical protein
VPARFVGAPLCASQKPDGPTSLRTDPLWIS